MIYVIWWENKEKLYFKIYFFNTENLNITLFSLNFLNFISKYILSFRAHQTYMDMLNIGKMISFLTKEQAHIIQGELNQPPSLYMKYIWRIYKSLPIYKGFTTSGN